MPELLLGKYGFIDIINSVRSPCGKAKSRYCRLQQIRIRLLTLLFKAMRMKGADSSKLLLTVCGKLHA
jgi:hypothetical protein